MIDLIYTSGNNATYARMTQEARWLVGMRSDRTPCDVPIQFVDIDYKAPNFARHLDMVRRFRPRYAVVPDLSEREVLQSDIDRALRQVDQLSAYCETILVIPKLAAQLASSLPISLSASLWFLITAASVRSNLKSCPCWKGGVFTYLGEALTGRWSYTAISRATRRLYRLMEICSSILVDAGSIGVRGSG